MLTEKNQLKLTRCYFETKQLELVKKKIFTYYYTDKHNINIRNTGTRHTYNLQFTYMYFIILYIFINMIKKLIF